MPLQRNEQLTASASIKDIIFEAITRWRIVVSIMAFCLVAAYIYTAFFCTPQYDSLAKLYIINNKDESVLNSGDISVSSYLAKDYEELIGDRTVLDEVITELDLGVSYSSLKRCVSINNPLNTRILEITVRTTDSVTSKKIADTICSVAQRKIVELMGADRVTIWSWGNLPTRQSTPNLRSNLIFGFLFGAVVSMVTVLICFYSDDKIKGPDDIEKHIGVSLLATIPYNRNRAKTS